MSSLFYYLIIQIQTLSDCHRMDQPLISNGMRRGFSNNVENKIRPTKKGGCSGFSIKSLGMRHRENNILSKNNHGSSK